MSFKPQTSFGAPRPIVTPAVHDLKLCRVTSTADAARTGRIEVVTVNGTAPNPALMLNAGSQCPYYQGQHVVVGFIDGNKDNPVVLGPVASLGLLDWVVYDPQANTLALQHPSSGARIELDSAGNISLLPGPGGTVRTP